MTPHDSQEVVRLATAPNPMQAHIWEQALRSEGIWCKVLGDYLDAGIGDISGLMAEVWIHPQDRLAAEAILQRGQKETDEEGAEETGAATPEETSGTAWEPQEP